MRIQLRVRKDIQFRLFKKLCIGVRLFRKNYKAYVRKELEDGR
jgi:hypothetical protein